MSLLKIALAGATSYAMYRLYRGAQTSQPPSAAFAVGEATEGFAPVRNAGPEAMRSDPGEWDRVDEASDESFPASDAPAVR